MIRLVKVRARFRRGDAPIDAHPSCDPAVKTLLLELMMLNERQRNSAAANSADKLHHSQLRFQLNAVLELMNVSLVDELLWHDCRSENCCKDEADFVQKLGYHLT